jgi:hypothetical protein
MPTSSVQNYFKDPDFLNLPEEEQVKVLQNVDREFAKLPQPAQVEIIKRGGKIVAPPSRRRFFQTAGGIAAGLGALRTGLVGRTAAVATGAAAGKRLDQLLEKESVVVPRDIMPTKQEAVEMAKGAAEEAAWEAGPGLLFKGARKALAPFRGSIDPHMKELNRFLTKKMRGYGYKTGLLPTEMAKGDNWFLQVYQNISEGALLGGGQLKKFKRARSEVLNDIADDVVSSYGERATTGNVANLFLDTIKRRKSFHQAVSDSLYNTVKKEAEGALIPTAALKKHAKELKEVADEIIEIGGGPAGYDLMGKIAAMPDEISYDAAQALRSNLLVAADEFRLVSKKAKGIGLAKHYTGLIDNAIEQSLKKHDVKLGKKAYSSWRQANQFHKTWKSRFDNATIRRLVHYADETGKGAGFIAQDTFKNPETVRLVRQALGEGSKEWRLFQSFYVQDLFKKSVDLESMREVVRSGRISKEGLVKGDMMLRQMYGKEGIGAETLNLIFTKTQLRRIDKFVDTLKATQRKEVEGIGKMWIQLTQGGAIMGFATGLAPEAAGLLLAPGLMAKMLTTETGAKILTDGIKVVKGDPRVAGISARIIKYILEMKEEKTTAIPPRKPEEQFVYTPDWT